MTNALREGTLAQQGRAWIKCGCYWIAYSTQPDPVIVAAFFDAANIPGRLQRRDSDRD